MALKVQGPMAPEHKSVLKGLREGLKSLGGLSLLYKLTSTAIMAGELK